MDFHFFSNNSRRKTRRQENSFNNWKGLITRDETEFLEGENPTIKEMMKPFDKIVSVNENTDIEQAYKIMKEKKVHYFKFKELGEKTSYYSRR